MESIWCVSVIITKVASGGSLLDPNPTMRWSSWARGLPQTCFAKVLTPGTKKYLRDFGSNLGLEKPDFGPECSRMLVVKTSPLALQTVTRCDTLPEYLGQAGPLPGGYSSKI